MSLDIPFNFDNRSDWGIFLRDTFFGFFWIIPLVLGVGDVIINCDYDDDDDGDGDGDAGDDCGYDL